MLNDPIAISGVKNSGKTEASYMLQYLLNAPKPFRRYFWYKIGLKFPKRGKIISFAKPLKKVLSVILGIDVHKFNDREFKENYFVFLDDFRIVEKYLLDDTDILSDNRFTKLIKSGEPLSTSTGLSIRQLMQYFGTECCQSYLGRKVWINATLKNSKNCIISDLRFKKEFEEIKYLGGSTIYIQRDSAKPGAHASEREMVELYNQNKFDYIVDNNGTLKDLFNNLKKTVGAVEK